MTEVAPTRVPADQQVVDMITKYAQSFADVLPSHLDPSTWLRVATGALKKGPRETIQLPSGERTTLFVLEIAALNNPASFLAALLEAARLGLEPGTETYYLTPRKVGGRNWQNYQILGIVGYQGYIELMHRAGAVTGVVAQVVREKDTYRRTVGAAPEHDYPPFVGEDERGPLLGVYAYANMEGGGISRVVELGRQDIEKIRAASAAGASPAGPWAKWEESMWLKSAVRQLRKWVPTSPEYRSSILAGTTAKHIAAAPDRPAVEAPARLQLTADMELPPTEDEFTAEVDDAEQVPDIDHPDGADPINQQATAPPPPAEPVDPLAAPVGRTAVVRIQTLCRGIIGGNGDDVRDQRLKLVGNIAGRAIGSTNDLTVAEAQEVVATLDTLANESAEERAAGVAAILALPAS